MTSCCDGAEAGIADGAEPDAIDIDFKAENEFDGIILPAEHSAIVIEPSVTGAFEGGACVIRFPAEKEIDGGIKEIGEEDELELQTMFDDEDCDIQKLLEISENPLFGYLSDLLCDDFSFFKAL